MSTSWNGESAKILQFPRGGRRGLESHRADARSMEEPEALRLPKIDFGDAWYHETAMQEAERVNRR
ncbi:MAG TPA: DUF2735 domain-containing protein [Geminicoccaceae bacterium]|nr:DUF2735 domain-containing protein [Geminicoccus sp.]HMU53039.1 DUF2735 domain-containing protein [Geminicoccaceae bacterium]